MKATFVCASETYNIIWALGTGEKRNVEHQFEIFDWQSKSRGEVHIGERPKGSEEDWTVLRNHWQVDLAAEDVEDILATVHA
jgi:hypothetical protein